MRTKTSLNRKQWGAIIREASELGVFCFIIAGGEPFLFPGLIELCEEFQDRFFLIFTNGTTIANADYKGPSLTYGDGIKAYVSATGEIHIYNSALAMVEN